MVFRIALLGFSDFERDALASCFRLAIHRLPAYLSVAQLGLADFAVVDADQATAVQSVLDAGRLADAVCIGSHAPAGAAAWIKRPIDPQHVIRELDALVAALEAPATPVRPQAATGPAPSALLVDDSELALHFLRQRLQRFAVKTEFASTSAKAIEMMARRDYDFVFLDVELGRDSEFDGLTLCQHIRRQHRHPAGPPATVVMVSAHHSELDRVRGSLAGCDAYLGKPLDEVELDRLMRRHGFNPLRSANVAPLI